MSNTIVLGENKSQGNTMNISRGNIFMGTKKEHFTKRGKKYLKRSANRLPIRVHKMMKDSKVVFNKVSGREMKVSSYNKTVTRKRLTQTYGSPTFIYGGVIQPKSNIWGRTHTQTTTGIAGYTRYNVRFENYHNDESLATGDIRELQDFLFYYIQSKTNIKREYHILIQLGTVGAGYYFLFPSQFKWKPYQTKERFDKAVEAGIHRLDKMIKTTPDAGDEAEDEPNTYLEKYPVRNLRVVVGSVEFLGGNWITFQEDVDGACNTNGKLNDIINGVLINNYRTTGNNCLFVVLKRFLNKKSVPKSNAIRESLNLPKGEAVSSSIIPELSQLLKVNIELYIFNEELNLILHSKSVAVGEWRTCMVLWKDGHYSHILKKEWNGDKMKCPNCNKAIIVSNMGKHTCNAGNITYVNRFIMKDRLGKVRMRKYQNFFDGTKIKENKSLQALGKYEYHNIVCDFECFPIKTNGVEVVYAVGMYYVETNTYYQWYGKDSLKDFMEWIEARNNEDNLGYNIIFYNGSGFDYYFMYHYLLEKGQDFHNQPLMNGGRILQMNWSKNRTFDLFLFTCPNSLDACVKGFKIREDAKGVFPHNFPTEWKDIYYKGKGRPRKDYPKSMLKKIDDKTCKWATIPKKFDFQQECLTYLKSDVMCLYYAYDAMRKELLGITGEDFRSYLTVSQMSYDFNASLLDKTDTAYLPQTREVYDLIDKSIYGGRTKPVKLRFENKILHKKFLNCKGNQRMLKKLMLKTRQKNEEMYVKGRENPEDICSLIDEYKDWEYLMPFDVKSLYPTTYSKPFPAGKGKMCRTGAEYYACRNEYLKDGFRIWFDTNGKFHKIKSYYAWGIYEVDIHHIPKHIIPVLPQKNEKGNTVWDCICRQGQHFCGEDLEEGIKKGYEFQIKRALIFKSGKCFLKRFVDKIYPMKEEQDKFKTSKDDAEASQYNPAKRMTLKIMLNACFGKFIQRPILENTEVIDTMEQNRKFHTKNEWSGFDILPNGKVLLTGIRKEFVGACNKPLQIGSYILAYSRTIMREYVDMVNPYRLTNQDKSMKLSFWYTDTDCIWISSLQKFMLEHRIGTKLGDMEDELEGGICVDSYFICPKVYCAKYYKEDKVQILDDDFNETGDTKQMVKVKTKMRAKGHPSHCLKPDYYKTVWEEGTIKTDTFTMFKKVRWDLNSNEKEKEISQITIVKKDCRRRLNKDTWRGRIKLKNGDTYPMGYFIPSQEEELDLMEDTEPLEDFVDEMGQLTDTPS